MAKKTQECFPKSWRKWRELRESETLRCTDRILFMGQSEQMGPMHKGQKIGPKHGCGMYPAGWYYRKVS